MTSIEFQHLINGDPPPLSELFEAISATRAAILSTDERYETAWRERARLADKLPWLVTALAQIRRRCDEAEATLRELRNASSTHTAEIAELERHLRDERERRQSVSRVAPNLVRALEDAQRARDTALADLDALVPVYRALKARFAELAPQEVRDACDRARQSRRPIIVRFPPTTKQIRRPERAESQVTVGAEPGGEPPPSATTAGTLSQTDTQTERKP